MPPELQPSAVELADHTIVTRGPYRLVRLSDDHLRLTGPDDRFPHQWLLDQVGDGEWWTEWSGDVHRLVVDIRR